MGNHEYCSSCGQSDFHSGRTCEEAYPKEYRKHQREKRKLEKEQNRARQALRRLAKAIKKEFQVNLEITDFEGRDSYIRIHYWDALKAEARQH